MEGAWWLLLLIPTVAKLRPNVSTRHRSSYYTVKRNHQPTHSLITTPRANPKNCYSCGSEKFVHISKNKNYLLPIARDPAMFTDQCDEPFRSRNIPQRRCYAPCITIRFDNNFMGQYLPLYYRGCVTDLKNYDVSVLRQIYQTRCKYVPMTTLLPKFPQNPQTTKMKVCTCDQNVCNRGLSSCARTSLISLVPFLLLLLLL